jgi:murein DD-endopeptidase MepM/ murein hydrolase activator NlpD
MRKVAVAIVLLLLGSSGSGVKVEVFPAAEGGRVQLSQGQALFVQVKSEAAAIEKAEGTIFGKSLLLSQGGAGWLGIVGVDMDQKPGDYELVISLSLADGKKVKREVRVRVSRRDFGTDHLTLPPEKVELTPEALARVQEDQQALGQAWRTPSSEAGWSGAFVRPVPGEVSGQFGRRRVINGEKKSPHTGQDLRAVMDEPVKASNAGRVVLVRDCFFSGNSVVLDHGLGLYSMYFHLDQVKVKEGDRVEKGQVIGLAGMTGRATGPHLHWGFRLAGARVDPDAILALPLP